MFHKLGFYIDLRKIGDFCGITLCGGLEYQYTVDWLQRNYYFRETSNTQPRIRIKIFSFEYYEPMFSDPVTFNERLFIRKLLQNHLI